MDPPGLCGRFFQLQGPFGPWWARAPPIVKWSDGQGCQGKVKGQGIVEHCYAPSPAEGFAPPRMVHGRCRPGCLYFFVHF